MPYAIAPYAIAPYAIAPDAIASYAIACCRGRRPAPPGPRIATYAMISYVPPLASAR